MFPPADSTVQTLTYTHADPGHRHTQRGHACTCAVWGDICSQPRSPSGSRNEPQAWEGGDHTHRNLAVHIHSQIYVGEPSGRRGPHVYQNTHIATAPFQSYKAPAWGCLGPISCSQGKTSRMMKARKIYPRPLLHLKPCHVIAALCMVGKASVGLQPPPLERRVHG